MYAYYVITFFSSYPHIGFYHYHKSLISTMLKSVHIGFYMGIYLSIYVGSFNQLIQW